MPDPVHQPISASAIQMAACSDSGQVREHNEDAVRIEPAYGLAVLADGMGGYQAGEVASAMAVELLAEALIPLLGAPHASAEPDIVHAYLEQAVAQANKTIYQKAQQDTDHTGMGTTLVLAHFGPDHLTVAHVGDSRLYRLRQGTLLQLTRDHSAVQDQIDLGLLTPALARNAPYRNLLTRAVGAEEDVLADIGIHALEPGDTYLLCSDGLHDMLETADIACVLNQNDRTLDELAQDLVSAANERGGWDNIAVILVALKGWAHAGRHVARHHARRASHGSHPKAG